MPIFSYKSISAAGKLRENKLEAASELLARSQLQRMGEQVVQIREISSAGGNVAGVSGGRKCKKPSTEEVSGTIRQMSLLIRAGVPLVESLQGLAEQVKSDTLRSCLTDMSLAVSQGTSLSDAFLMHPNVFPSLAAEMAKIAEAGGSLSDAMARLADHTETSTQITQKVKSALAYPVVVMILSFATVLVMVTFILPRFMKMFDKMGAELPWTTKMLMSLSHLLTSKWYIFIILGAAIFYGFKHFANTPGGKLKIDTFILKIPVVGDIVNKVLLSRVVASMSTLLQSGVPMVKTLETSAAAANNEYIKNALLRARNDVAEGSATSQSLKATGVFPPLVIQMVASGEKTSELATMLEYVCTLYSQETDAKVKSLTSIIEPIMVVVLGLIVGFIAMSVIVPIYSLVGGVK